MTHNTSARSAARVQSIPPAPPVADRVAPRLRCTAAMDQADLTEEQCRRRRDALAPHVAWLRRLHERMDRRRRRAD